MGNFDAFNRNFIGIGFQIGRSHLYRKTPRRRPSRNWHMLFIEQADDYVAPVIDPLIGDGIQPGVVIKIAFKFATF